MKNSRAILGVSLLFSVATYAGTPNTTAASSVPYEVGQGYVTHYFDESTTTRWYRFAELGGHSYCVEAVQGPVSPIALDPNLTVYTDATGTTVLTVDSVAQSNDNANGEPYLISGARTCYISPGATYGAPTVRGFKVNVPISAGSGDAGYVKIRVVDTTLFGELSVADTVQTITVTNRSGSSIKWFGFQYASGSTTLNRATYTNTLAAYQRGYAGSLHGYTFTPNYVTVIAHNGAPGAFSAYMTATSGTSAGTTSLYVPILHELVTR